MRQLTPCSKAELEAYVRRTPGLTPMYTAISDPPAVFWQDAEGKIVARYWVGDERAAEHGWAVRLDPPVLAPAKVLPK